MKRRCFACGCEVRETAGDPGKWPHIVGINDATGVGRTFCGSCVSVAMIAHLDAKYGSARETGRRT